MSTDALHRPAVAELLDDVGRAVVAVDARNGPHLTPLAFVAWSRRLWFVTPRDSLKGRVLRARTRTSVLVRGANRAVIICGDAWIVDPLDPVGSAAALPEAALGGRALVRYAFRHRRQIGGAARDALRLRLRIRPRVLVAVRPRRGAVVEGDRVVEQWGRWPGRATAAFQGGSWIEGGEASSADPSAPSDGSADVAVGWATPGGPLVLPGRWDHETRRAWIPGSVIELADAPWRSPAAVAGDAPGASPSSHSGFLVRGSGRVGVERGRAFVEVDGERTTIWSGEHSETVRVADRRSG